MSGPQVGALASVIAAASVVAGVVLTACSSAPSAPTYNDCVARVVQAAVGYNDLDNQSPDISCTITAGADAGSVLAPGRNRNIVLVTAADGGQRTQYAGTYFDCVDLVSRRELDACLVVDGPDAGRETSLDPSGDVVVGQAVNR